jgi:DNA-binding CsgD family transcriptional regulator
MSEPARPTAPPSYLEGRYRLVAYLGEGSVGVVYRAHDETLDRDVAVKFLSRDRIPGQEASARFLREARTVARLSHPNIVTLYDVGREGDWHYLILEYIPGQDLHALMVDRGGALSVREAVHAIRGVLEALAYAHARGIVHRDVKPENVMRTSDGRILVTDFGLALARGDVRLTQQGLVVGTVLYLAPEVVSGQPVDCRADLYAVGAVLYELLTGRPPFDGDDPLAVLAQILHAPVTPPRALNPAVPHEIQRVILNLLSRHSADRLASAAEVLDALRGVGDAAAVEEERGAAVSVLERMVRSASSTQIQVAALADPDQAPLFALPATEDAALPDRTAALLVTAASEDMSTAVEAERVRLAELLQSQVVDLLNLLLSQANAYEQTMGANPAARMAVSVLSSLAQQVLQRVRDLEANLHPAILGTLGLEPALEALASQATRVHGLQVTLHLERMRERPPPQIELALFRAAQDALDRAVRRAHASWVTVRLQQKERQLLFSLSDNGTAQIDGSGSSVALQRIEQLGGTIQTGTGPGGGRTLRISFAFDAPVKLTPREMEVIERLAEGLSNKEIARVLSISPRTVNFHLDNLYSKLGVNSRTEAAICALRRGWVRRA